MNFAKAKEKGKTKAIFVEEIESRDEYLGKLLDEAELALNQNDAEALRSVLKSVAEPDRTELGKNVVTMILLKEDGEQSTRKEEYSPEILKILHPYRE